MRPVNRRRLVWVLCLALAAIGSLAGHWLAYVLAAPGHAERAGLLAGTGHGYLAYAPVVVGLCVAAILVSLVGCVVHAKGGQRNVGMPPLLFAVLPAVAFTVQEHLERLLHHGGGSALAAADPLFFFGLLIQLPLALAALAVARALLAFAENLVKPGRGVWRVARVATPSGLVPIPAVSPPRISALALGHGQRSPPHSSVAT